MDRCRSGSVGGKERSEGGLKMASAQKSITISLDKSDEAAIRNFIRHVRENVGVDLSRTAAAKAMMRQAAKNLESQNSVD